MTEHILVLGAGYAGSMVIQTLEEQLRDVDAQLTWISKHDYHLMLHEIHRLIRNPGLRDILTIPVEEIKRQGTPFEQQTVEKIRGKERIVEFTDGTTMEFDYVVDCLGSQTAYYDIDGLREHALTLKSLDDALAIHSETTGAAAAASLDEPATVVVGGAGLSGIEGAGELAEFRDQRNLPLDVRLVEAKDEIFPGQDHQFQGALRQQLVDHEINISTGDPIVEVDDESVHFNSGRSADYDVLVWTGGVTGHRELDDPEVELERGRTKVDDTLQSADERIFVVGDSAIVELAEAPPPPTAQAAWQAAEVAAENVIRTIRGQSLRHWTYEDMGTVVSIGDDAIAHEIKFVPVNTFDTAVASYLKRAVTTRWVNKVSSRRRAARTWQAI
ncbi:NAD(P)/FAD-dependent oxidoreductase [halophilic archaeon]|nr:NAD(P)/FAD-dependent oxidoreductase [halophilic archaeon]